jgi:hypothetical protein
VDIFAFKIRRWLGPLGYLLAGLEIALERSGLGVDEADCRIAPALAGKTYLRFSRRDELFELGRQAALIQLPTILHDLGMENTLSTGQASAHVNCTQSAQN